LADVGRRESPRIHPEEKKFVILGEPSEFVARVLRAQQQFSRESKDLHFRPARFTNRTQGTNRSLTSSSSSAPCTRARRESVAQPPK